MPSHSRWRTTVRIASRDLLERRLDKRFADRRERAAFDAPGDLEQRVSEAGGKVFFFDQTREQVGLAVRHVRLEHRSRGLPDVAAENVEGRLMIPGVVGR